MGKEHPLNPWDHNSISPLKTTSFEVPHCQTKPMQISVSVGYLHSPIPTQSLYIYLGTRYALTFRLRFPNIKEPKLNNAKNQKTSKTCHTNELEKLNAASVNKCTVTKTENCTTNDFTGAPHLFPFRSLCLSGVIVRFVSM